MRAPIRPVVLIGGLIAAPLFAGELTPYPPPVQQAAPMIKMPRKATRPRAVAPDATYQRFEQDARALRPSERQALARSFEARRKDAARSGDTARELHYLRLLDVLRRTGGG